MNMIEEIVNSISDFLWGWPLVLAIFGVSIIMSIAFNWVQIRYFWQSWRLVFSVSEHKSHGADYITPLQAFLNTLSASLGNGSAAGMATAIASGGPGAAFWIFVVGFFGIALRFAEVYASSYFIDEDRNGTFRGGPMVYLNLVPGKKYLPALYAVFCLLTAFIAGSAMQCNSMTIGIERLTGLDKTVIALLLCAAMFYVLYGGAQRIIQFSDKIIPVKVGLFFISITFLLVYHAAAIPAALITIVKYAFTWQAVAGAGVGYTVQTALRYGISRSVSATELGLGTAGVLFGATGGKEPFKNGVMSMASLMISNHLVCCLLLLLFVASGVWDSGLTSTALTSAAFETLFGLSGKIIVTFLSISFGLGVLVSYAYIGRECWLYLLPKISTKYYTMIYAGMSIFGIFGSVGIVWSAVDMVNAGMLIMNMYGLMMLLPLLRAAIKKNNSGDTKPYFAEASKGRPVVHEAYKVAAHTRNIKRGSTFVAIPGTKENGTDYIRDALQKGATTVVLSHDAVVHEDLSKVKSYRVANTRKALAELSAHAYNFPAKKLKFIAITGTKGKTTTTYLVEHILKSAGIKTARLSTVSNAILNYEYPTQLTTQQPDYIHMFLDACVQHDVEWVVIEVAAQALSLHRVHGIEFDVVIFTNFSQEHGEFYATQDEYFAAKASIIKQLKSTGLLILNGDDVRVTTLSVCHPELVSGSLSSLKDIQILAASRAGVKCVIDDLVFENQNLLGTFNVHNIHMAYLAARFIISAPACRSELAKPEGVDKRSLETIQQAVATFAGVPGRLNKYSLAREVTAYIDYAHTPSSMQAVLETLRAETEQLIVVFGAGGERDPIKRPIMGNIAAERADDIILTTDNPRGEDAQKIMNDILAGVPAHLMHKVHVEYDREVAIKYAYTIAQTGAIITLLGKGPDEYQLIQGVKYPFSERAILHSL